MNNIERIADRLSAEFPHTKFRLAVPLQAEDVWTLSAEKPSGYYLEVAYWPKAGFGISSGASVPFLRSDEVYISYSGALTRALELLRHELHTE